MICCVIMLKVFLNQFSYTILKHSSLKIGLMNISSAHSESAKIARQKRKIILKERRDGRVRSPENTMRNDKSSITQISCLTNSLHCNAHIISVVTKNNCCIANSISNYISNFPEYKFAHQQA